MKHSAAGSIQWIGQAASGLALLILLAVHLIAQHFIVEGGLRTYDQVLAYITQPFILGWEICFLVVATYHGLAGLRSILLDFGLTPEQDRRVTVWLVVSGGATVTYGLWLLLTLLSRDSLFQSF
jgi:succinate dehydrogenase / fumarate reductase membrane anchor subunit